MNSWMVAHEALVTAIRTIDKVLGDYNPKRHGDIRVEVWQRDAVILDTALPYAWGTESIDAAWAAAPLVPHDTIISHHNLVPNAWWHFERTLPVQSTSNPSERVRALCMGWLGDAFILTVWIDDVEGVTQILPSQVWTWLRGETIAEMQNRVRQEHHAMYGPGGKYAAVPQIGVEAFLDVTMKLSTFILAGVAWMSQKLLTQTEGPIERHRRKDYRRTFHREPPAVRVVQLRRIEHARKSEGDETKTRVEWSCRWTVGGHFRNQVCGPKRGDRKLMYISPYLKGPDDKPLRITNRAYEVNR